MLAYVGVGSNLGDRWANLALAARTLRAEPQVALLRASRVYDTAPVGGPPQGRYLNAVLELETALPPARLFSLLQMTENAAGRKRTTERWAARTLDLDLLLYGEDVLRTQALVIPHPAIPNRRFVLGPLAELCPDRVVPGTGHTVAQLLHRAPPGDIVCAGLYPM